MKNTFSKVIVLLMCLAMLVGMVSTVAFAAVDYTEETDDYYNVISHKEWDLAPGITEAEIVLNSDAGDRRQVMHVVEVDMNNEYTKVIPSYKGMTPTAGSYGVQTMDLQAAYAEANGYGNVVAAMNLSLSWYNTDYYAQNPHLIGEPLGYMILDGVQYTNSCGKSGGAQTCLVINFDEKNGEARPTDIPKVQIRSTSDAITGWEEQVIPANFGFTVKDGKLVVTAEEHASEGAPRSMVGVKADGTIVMVMNDGRQSPYSIGFNSYEMGEAMLNLGCVYAINGDGGGSSQFLSQRPGEELELHCSPSDGAPRATTHGILVITTAPSDGTFVRAHVEAENAYYTPNSTVQFTAVGADLAGGAAEIPAEAYWALSDDTMGTIDANGLFASNGKVGAVTVHLMYDGKSYGESTINIVNPDAIAFSKAAYAVPFESAIEFSVVATYGVYEVTLKEGDYDIVLANSAAGTIDSDYVFTSGTEAVNTSVTVTYNGDTSVNSTVALLVGKGSEVIFDFESDNASGDINNWVLKVHAGDAITDPKDKTSLNIVNRETGMVHSGEQAIAMNIPFHNFVFGSDSSYDARSFQWVGDTITLENAISVGLWVYIPEEATQTMLYIAGVWYDANGAVQRGDKEAITIDQFDGVEYSGWHYVSVPIDKEFFYIGDSNVAKKRNFFLKFYSTSESALSGDETSYFPDVTYYIDDVTVDYSSVVSDRENPVFGSSYAYNLTTEGQTSLVKGSAVKLANASYSYAAVVADDMTKENATGIDVASVKVYIDGVAVNASYRNGEIVTDSLTLAAGVHRIVFEASDAEGNVSKIVRYVSIEGDTPAIQVIPKSDAESILTGSVYWLDIVASDAENVKSVTLKLDLDTMHAWELAYSELAEGCTMNYYFATASEKAEDIITVELTLNGSVAGEAILASLPVRVWYSDGNSESGNGPALMWSGKEIIDTTVNVEVEKGVVVFVDDTTSTFSADKISVDTEAFTFGNNMQASYNDYFLNNTYHVHTPVALDNLDATCTKNGYTDRTFCEVCNSVVEWGTSVPATGHTYEVVGNEIACACGDIYEGNGIVNVNGNAYYMTSNKLNSGWWMLDGGWYYFDTTTYAAVESYNNGVVTYTFEADGKLTSGVWYENSWGRRYYYGPDYYLGTMFGTWKTIDGVQYCFDNSGYVMTGYQALRNSHNDPFLVYKFAEDGSFIEAVDGYNGFVYGFDGTRYFINGTMAKGLNEIDGKYYYFSTHTGIVRTGEYTVTVANSNGLLTEATTFYFDNKTGAADIPVESGFKVENGNTYYVLEDGTMALGLHEIEGKYYYFSTHTGIMRTGEYTVNYLNSNGLLTENTKFYFDETTGAADIPSKGGFKVENGNTYYYFEDGTMALGLQAIDGKYYYFSTHTGIMRTGEYTVNYLNSNGLLTENTKFYFDETTGAADIPSKGGFKVENGNTYYYLEDGTMALGLQAINGKYYYFSTHTGIMRTGEYIVTVANSNGLLTESTKFYFDETTGAANVPVPSGFKVENGNTYYVLEDGTLALGLHKIDGKYYYFSTHTGAMRTGTYTVNYLNSNGLLTESKTIILDATYGYAVDANGDPLTSLD